MAFDFDPPEVKVTEPDRPKILDAIRDAAEALSVGEELRIKRTAYNGFVIEHTPVAVHPAED